MLAAEQTAMVEEELQHLQVVGPEVPAQEEVLAQPAVDILDDRTGPYRLAVNRRYRHAQVVKPPAELLPQGGLHRSTARIVHVPRLEVQQRPHNGWRDR